MINEMIGIFILSLILLLVRYKIISVVYLIFLYILRNIYKDIEDDKDNKIVGFIGQKDKLLIEIVIEIAILTIQFLLIYEFVGFLQTIPTIYKDIVNYTLSIINNGI